MPKMAILGTYGQFSQKLSDNFSFLFGQMKQPYDVIWCERRFDLMAPFWGSVRELRVGLSHFQALSYAL